MSLMASARLSFLSVAACALLAAAPPAEAQASPQFQVLYMFQGAPGGDGGEPLGGVVIGPGGLLYGSTAVGGSVCPGIGCGTVYQLTPPVAAGQMGTETQLYAFTGGDDGSYPQGELVRDPASGTLYGTAQVAGPPSEGTAYALAPPAVAGGDWSFGLLYGFGATDRDGEQPASGLLAGPAGSLYGTTTAGGSVTPPGLQVGSGTVFQLLPPAAAGDLWTHVVLRAFAPCCVAAFGAIPSPGVLLALADGSLAGATLGGGANGGGIVFDLRPPAVSGAAWTELPAHDFTTAQGGRVPNAGLVADANGVLYGTTQDGGIVSGAHCNGNCGVVFQLVPPVPPATRPTYRVIYRFKGGEDGAVPLTGVVVGTGGVLYGTTFIGGVTRNCPNGCGTVFQLAPPSSDSGVWQETVLHRFDQNDGTGPQGRLAIGPGGILYGTTWEGGSSGYGVVFSVQP